MGLVGLITIMDHVEADWLPGAQGEELQPAVSEAELSR
jgi:hypothetical protein